MRVRSQSPAAPSSASSAASCSGTDPLAPQGAALPFLPTLVTALALGGFGLLCRAPTQPQAVPAPPTEFATRMIEAPTTTGSIAIAPLPGVEAFGRQFPLSTAEAAAPLPPRASRVATVAKHRCASGRCEPPRPAAAQPSEPSAARATTPWTPQRRPDESEDAMPYEALPFAPTAAAMLDGVRNLGNRALTLGGSVAALIASE